MTAIKTTIVGSLPKPSWLAKPEVLWAPWQLEGEQLAEGKRDAVRTVLKMQEQAGIDIVGDGEQTRMHFVHGFLRGIAGVDFDKLKRIGIRADRYEADCPTVVAPVAWRSPVHADEVKFARANTTRRLKFTLPGPMTMVDTLADEYYKDRAKLAFALAEILNQEAKMLVAAGADTIQFDEPAFNVYLDEVRDWGVAALERAAQGLTCTTAVHICYGYGIKANDDWKKTLGGQWRQYESTFPLLSKSSIKQVSLECANSHVPIELIGLLKDKDVLVGAIDVASNVVETPQQVAATLREAMKYVPIERIHGCTNCGMAPMARPIAEAKLHALAAGARLLSQELSG
jgi:5-methyltetrahydropteroyltriglutamate--homocysteine methyltransferase